MDKILVSAVIITKNRKNLLEKALTSIFRQTYKNIEIIIVDDASTDGSEQYIKEIFSNYKFKYFYILPENSRGGNYARNIGIKNSNGKFVAFLDDDDEWKAEKIEKQVKHWNENKTSECIACGLIKEYDSKHREKQSINKLQEGDFSTKIFTTIPYVTSTLFIKTQLLKDIGLFDENLMFWQEYELLIRIAQKTKITAVKECLVLYRNYSTDKNRLTNNLEKWEKSIKIIEKKHKKLIKNLTFKTIIKHKLLIAKDRFKKSFCIKKH